LTCPQNKSIFFDMKSGHASSIPPQWLYLSRLFSALGDEERQRILLSFPPAGQLNASQIARASTLSRPTVSHHLKLLCEAGVLDRTKQGREIHFRLRAPQLIENLQSVIDYLEAHR
jgi:ArsR family transcriptional regulator